jgi:pimeloyl-ACP methyl ester carboxylesterase
MVSLPTIVLIPGAWHSPVHYQELVNLLEAARYTLSSSSLPSLDPADPDAVTTRTDSKFIAEKLLAPLLDEGNDIILVAHSYGGSPGSAAARGLSKTERASQGLNGGVIGLIFIAAFVVPEGVSLRDGVGGQFPPWVQVDVCCLLYPDPQPP